jgi:hypothetical protein
MIGCFPDPYPDELLYSVCARYHTRMMYFSSGYKTIQELFGNTSGVTIDLPTRLEYLTTALPPGHRYTVDYLIDRHTLLPFYSPFLTVERVERIYPILIIRFFLKLLKMLPGYLSSAA